MRTVQDVHEDFGRLHPDDQTYQIAMARVRLRLFGAYVTSAWDWTPKHIALMAQKLEAVERGEIKRLMIFMPPRSGKSELTSIHFPAWYLLKNPDKRVISASYSTSLAEDFSRRARALVREFGKSIFGVELSDESASADQWGLKGHHGQYVAAGYGAGITGRGASLLILDDVVKNAEEANSPTYRQKLWDWYTSTAYTRLEPDGAVVICVTRWHLDDLAGRLLAQMEAGGEQWEVIRLPALAEDSDDALGREPGAPLWPERYGVDEYARIRTAVGSYVWNALYQQRPMDAEGGVFKALWLRWYTSAELHRDETGDWYYHDQRLTIYGGVDPAMSEKDSADEFAMVTIGITPAGDAVVLDILHDHIEPGAQAAVVRAAYAKWRHKRIAVEINGGQRYLYAQVKGDVPALQVTHKTDKFSRIANMAPDVENGLLLLREATDNEAAILDDVRLPGRRIHHSMRGLYEQMVTYTNTAAHDDRLDALEEAWSIVRTGRTHIIQPQAAPSRLAEPLPAMEPDLAGIAVEGAIRVAMQQGAMLPSAVLKSSRAHASDACPHCGATYTKKRGAARYCPAHGWQGAPGGSLEQYRVR